MTVALPSILLALLFALNVPVAFAIAISALSFFFLADGLPMDIFFQKMVSATDSYPLLAVPFFVSPEPDERRRHHPAAAAPGRCAGRAPDRRAGAGLHRAGDLAGRADGLVLGRCGDAGEAARAGDGEARLSAAFAAAITSSAAIITALIPPGIGLIIYGYLADVSVGRLFLAAWCRACCWRRRSS